MAKSEQDLEIVLPEIDGPTEGIDTTCVNCDDGWEDDPAWLEIAPPVTAQQLDGITPPERVRFTAPLILKPEGEDETYDWVVVNLSVQGMACLAPVDLNAGQRIWATLSLDLAAEPETFLCEVIWRQPPQDEHAAYGLQFKSLTRAEAERIRETVRERTDGRAGHWPLPVMPQHEKPRATRSPSPLLSAAAGMVAGICLALALSVIPSVGVSSTTPTLAPAPAFVTEKAPVAPPAATPTQVATPATPAPPPVELALVTDGAVQEYETFWLQSPRRLVVDIFGVKNGFARKSYEIAHPLAQRLRVGTHADKVRFVIEAAEATATAFDADIKGASLVVTLRTK